MSHKKANKPKAVTKISPVMKPSGMTLDQWQVVLRQQIARDSRLRIQNVGGHPVFSNFRVSNPQTRKSYRVFIGGEALGMSYCSCPDFAVNALGTCKHIESVLSRLRRARDNRDLLRAGWQPERPAVSLRYGLKRQVVFLPGRKMSDRLRSLMNAHFQDGLLAEHGFDRFDELRQGVAQLKEKVDYHEDALNFIAQIRDKNRLQEMIRKSFPQGIDDPAWDDLCKIRLYPYQREGALFAAASGRVLIADEMGLGKTLQAVAAAEILVRLLGIDKILIVCPASLKHQWKTEIERAVNRQARIISGPLPDRRQQYRQESLFHIINYDVIRRDADMVQRLKPDLIILDEAQRIKNWRTRLAQSVKQLQSPYAIVLTGTPLENRLEELHSIVEFIDRHHLGSLFRFLDRHQMVNEDGKMVGYKHLNDLGKSLETIMIRRNRREVLAQLPGRVDKNYFVPMTPAQMAIHEEYREWVARLVSKWRRCHFLTEEEKRRLMMAMQKMRMVCNSTYLIDETTDSGNKINELETQLGEILENPENKIILFSQWLRTMDLIIRSLNRRRWKYVFLHGGVPSIKRGDLIEKFREDKNCRLFLSTEAGGLGLNLQQASCVINMDLPWNPAVLEQRIGRAHRMGQKNVVRVINFIAENSIEHRMLSLLQFKKSVFSGALDEGDDQVLMGESQFHQFIKTVDEATEELDKAQGAAAAQPAPVLSSETPVGMSSPVEPPASHPSSLPLFIKMAGDFLQKISETMQSAQGERSGAPHPSSFSQEMGGGSLGLGGMRLHTDQATGRKSLHIPLPDDQTLNRLARVLGEIFEKAQ